ncbi:MAG: DNA polymerase III subunit delta [Prevotellaceae bacterium]|jgi:DNA polymerase-3 subunit delta|nr:DNA polymerase III subunit delta [Prevotellaceae bacterium]
MAKPRFDDVKSGYERIMSDLSKKIYKPVYLLMGEESYYIDLISNYIQENVLSEADKTFNQTVLYGRDINTKVVVEAARRYPMMGSYQVVVVREAQEIKDSIEKLKIYVDSPLKSTILVICYKTKTVDRRTGFYKQIAKVGEVFESASPYDDKIPDWITDYLRSKQRSIDTGAAKILADHIGDNLSKIVNELDKLAVIVPQSSKITAEHIERNIGISKDYNPFELCKAINTGNVLKANRIIMHFERDPDSNPIPRIITVLFSNFSKIFLLHMLKVKYKNAPIPPTEVQGVLGITTYLLREYEAAARRFSSTKAAGVIALLREFDMRSKGWNNASTGYGDLMREMVYKIMH